MRRGATLALGQLGPCEQRIDFFLRIAPGRTIDQIAINMGREPGDEVVHVPPQQPVAGKSDPGLVTWKQMRRAEGGQVTVLGGMRATLATIPTPRPNRTYVLMTSASRAVSATFATRPAFAKASCKEEGPAKLNT